MSPNIVLYTAHHCPWAYRAQIALRELGLAFETVVIDISVPRSPEYLAINPCGMVPALVYNGHVLTESGLIVQFLADAHPSHLLRSTSEAESALHRFRVGFFVDTYFNKAHPFYDKALYAYGEDERVAAEKYVNAIVQHIEPLLADAKPFFGGSAQLTLVEVLTGSFLLRLLSLPKHEGILPMLILTDLETRAPNFWQWSHAVAAQENVTAVWDEKDVVERTLIRIKKEQGAVRAA